MATSSMVAGVRVRGARLVEQELNLMGTRATDLHGIWPAITEYLETAVREQYETRGGRSGDPWPENSQAWQWYKFQHGLSLELGKATEDTFRALTNSFDQNAIREAFDEELTFGADTHAFPFQQDPAYDAPYPARVPVDLTYRDSQNIAEAMMGWILGTVNTAGQRVDPATRRFAPGGSVFG